MTTTTRTPKRTPRPTRPVLVTWHAAPIWPCELLPEGRPGLVEITDGRGATGLYPVHVLADWTESGPKTLALRFLKEDGAIYDVSPDVHPTTGAPCWKCDCASGCFRPERVCKHIRSVEQLFTEEN